MNRLEWFRSQCIAAHTTCHATATRLRQAARAIVQRAGGCTSCCGFDMAGPRLPGCQDRHLCKLANDAIRDTEWPRELSIVESEYFWFQSNFHRMLNLRPVQYQWATVTWAGCVADATYQVARVEEGGIVVNASSATRLEYRFIPFQFCAPILTCPRCGERGTADDLAWWPTETCCGPCQDAAEEAGEGRRWG